MTGVINDQMLFSAVQAGDRKAFDRLYLQHWERLYRLAIRRTDDEDTAKDIVQEVFVSLWQRRSEITLETSIDLYLAGAVKYRLINHFASTKVRRGVFQKVLQQMNDQIGYIDDLEAYREVEKALEAELVLMPANMRDAFILRMDEHSIREIALRLGLAEQTISNNLSEATRRLRKALRHRFPGTLLIVTETTLTLIHDILTKK